MAVKKIKRKHNNKRYLNETIQFVDTKGLEFIGEGVTGRVYKISRTHVIKVYCNTDNWYYEEKASDLRAMVEELEAGLKSKWVLPVEEIAIAKFRNKYYYASIKKYIPYKCSMAEIIKIERLLPDDLSWDCHSGNIRKDKNNRLWLIDSHGSD